MSPRRGGAAAPGARALLAAVLLCAALHAAAAGRMLLVEPQSGTTPEQLDFQVPHRTQPFEVLVPRAPMGAPAAGADDANADADADGANAVQQPLLPAQPAPPAASQQKPVQAQPPVRRPMTDLQKRMLGQPQRDPEAEPQQPQPPAKAQEPQEPAKEQVPPPPQQEVVEQEQPRSHRSSHKPRQRRHRQADQKTEQEQPAAKPQQPWARVKAQAFSLPLGPPLPSRYVSGWIPVDEGKRELFYVFGEAHKEPEKAPVVFWMNGGPGCSSLGLGFWPANGPFMPVSTPEKLVANPYAWTSMANMIWLEQPAFTGFSVSSDEADRVSDDDKAVEDMLAFLVEFYATHSQFKTNPLFLVGVSYAGHYGPLLAKRILAYNKAEAARGSKLPLAGLAMGNAWTDSYYDNRGTLETWYGKGMISKRTFDGLMDCDLAHGALWRTDGPSGFTKECEALRDAAYRETAGVQLLGLNAPTCLSRNQSHLITPDPTGAYYGHPVSDPCAKYVASELMNDRRVQVALGVIGPDEPARPWAACNSRNLTWSTRDLTRSMLPTYRKLIKEGLPILVYTGDTDTYVPIAGTRAWIESMELPLADDATPVRAWKEATTGQVGGWTVEYKGLTWVTIRWAGHAAAAYQPLRTNQVIAAFMAGSKLPSM